MNNRRRLVAVLCASTLVSPSTVLAQQAAKTPPRLGILLFGTPDADPNASAFRQGLRDLGYVQAKNIAIEYRYAAGKAERLPELAKELVALKPDVIFALGGDVAPFVRAATSTIPVVIAVSNDPVQGGLVASLSRPGGNVTGVTFIASELAGKRLQLLRDIAPRVSRIGVVWNPDHVDPESRETQLAAQKLGVQIQSLEVRSESDFDAAFQLAISARVEALIVVSSRLMTANRTRITTFAADRRLVLVSGWGPWTTGGALFSYGPDLNVINHRAASYVDRILKGARPADMPIERPTHFELIVNGKTAKALGLSIPQSVLILANKVID